MKRKRLFALLAVFLLVTGGCAGTISLQSIDRGDITKDALFDSYQYASGTGGRQRAVFLVMPESGLEVVFQSTQGKKVRSSFAEAVSFMEAAAFGKRTVYEEVMHEGRRIGFLLTQRRSSFAPEWLEISLFIRDGRVHFEVWEEGVRD